MITGSQRLSLLQERNGSGNQATPSRPGNGSRSVTDEFELAKLDAVAAHRRGPVGHACACSREVLHHMKVTPIGSDHEDV
ncbi:MAG: hypothetical protein QOG54_1354 [Actinomycetota bacterium]|nr:hypothetical protein [Actinomycetota bacterium]